MAELSTIYAKNKEIDLTAVSETDKAVHQYVFSENKNIQEEGRFPVYLALSELRRGSLTGTILVVMRESLRLAAVTAR